MQESQSRRLGVIAEASSLNIVTAIYIKPRGVHCVPSLWDRFIFRSSPAPAIFVLYRPSRRRLNRMESDGYACRATLVTERALNIYASPGLLLTFILT